MAQPNAMTTPILARLVGARLTHDLSGPLGTIMAASGLGAGPGGMRSDELLAESVAELRLRLRLYAAVFGEADAMRWDELHELLGGSPAAHRVAFKFEAAGSAVVPAPKAQLVLAAAMLGAEALPRGGTVRLAAAAGGTVTILPEGRVALWPHSLLERLAGMPPTEPDNPRALLAPWMLSLAGLAGMRVSLGLGGTGIPPLLLHAAG